jgi:hypothetical protein
MARSNSAVVWNLFKKESSDDGLLVASCLLCEYNTPYGAESSPSNLVAHVKHNHPPVFSLLEIIKSLQTQKPAPSTPKIDRFVSSKGASEQQLSTLVESLIFDDLLPFTILESDALRGICKLANPNYKPLSRRTFVRTNLLEKKASVEGAIRTALQSALYGAVSYDVDVYTKNGQALLGYSVQFFDERTMQLCHHSLAVFRVSCEKVFALQEAVNKIMLKYSISHNRQAPGSSLCPFIVGAAIDNASTEVKVISYSAILHDVTSLMLFSFLRTCNTFEFCVPRIPLLFQSRVPSPSPRLHCTFKRSARSASTCAKAFQPRQVRLSHAFSRNFCMD